MQVLEGVCILFSRIIPLEQSPKEHRLWQLAELFGATCFACTDPSVTHVITNTIGTQKARAPGNRGTLACGSCSVACSAPAAHRIKDLLLAPAHVHLEHDST